MLCFLMVVCVQVVVFLFGYVNFMVEIEIEGMDFFDLVDGEGNVLIQVYGVDVVNVEVWV